MKATQVIRSATDVWASAIPYVKSWPPESIEPQVVVTATGTAICKRTGV